MQVDSIASLGKNPGQSGSALVGLLSDGGKAAKSLGGPISSCQELFNLHLSPAGPGQTFLVAQSAWGVDAGQAARLAYGEIARVLQDQGLIMVHERLFGSLTAKSVVMASRAAALKAGNLSPEGPVTYIQGHPPGGRALPGSSYRRCPASIPRMRSGPSCTTESRQVRAGGGRKQLSSGCKIFRDWRWARSKSIRAPSRLNG